MVCWWKEPPPDLIVLECVGELTPTGAVKVTWGVVPGGRSLGKCEATLPPAAHTPSAVAGLVTAHGRSVAEHNHGFKKLGDKAWRRRAVLTTGRNGITGGDRSE